MRISVSKLDAFRAARDGAKDPAQFIEDIKTPFEGNVYTGTGKAFHKIMENPIQYKHNGFYEFKDYRFFGLQEYIPKDIYSPLWCSEVKTVNKIPELDVEISGIADVLFGEIVRDYKTRWRPLSNFNQYYDSFQWRLYLWMFGANKFIYDIYSIKKAKDGTIDITAHDEFECVRYPALVFDCMDLIEEMKGFIIENKLEKYMVSHKKG